MIWTTDSSGGTPAPFFLPSYSRTMPRGSLLEVCLSRRGARRRKYDCPPVLRMEAPGADRCTRAFLRAFRAFPLSGVLDQRRIHQPFAAPYANEGGHGILGQKRRALAESLGSRALRHKELPEPLWGIGHLRTPRDSQRDRRSRQAQARVGRASGCPVSRGR